MRKKPIGYYDYTVILTYIGMLLAFCGILRVISGDYLISAALLVLSGLCDMFDGPIARTKKRGWEETRFGIQIDSFSDLISFGVFPAIYGFMISGKTVLGAVIACAYVLCALIRLGYFNVVEEAKQDRGEKGGGTIIGVPTTIIALLMPYLFLFHYMGIVKRTFWFPVLLAAMAVGFLLPIEFKKPGKVGKIVLFILGTTGVFIVTPIVVYFLK